MNTDGKKTEGRINLFFSYFEDVFEDCGRLLADEDYAHRKEIVLTTLFSVLSLSATGYCRGGKRTGTKIQNEAEFIAFLAEFWVSEEKDKKFRIRGNNCRRIEVNGRELLWKIRNLFAHEFRPPGMAFPSMEDQEVIISCPVENRSAGQTNTEFEIHPGNFLRDMKQMSRSFKSYRLEQGLDPRTNLPYRELYLD